MVIFPNPELPLAELLRPTSLESYVGQEHLVNSKSGAIMNFLHMKYLPSMILHGPPGVGKTTLASIMASHTNYVFLELSATDSTVSDIRELLGAIRNENVKRKAKNVDWLRVVVFIDEIHRFTTVQQDFLLPFVESGDFVFVGATSVDPHKRVRSAILSRCQLYKLEALTETEVIKVLRRAVLYENIRRKMSGYRFISYSDSAIEIIAKNANGDTRAAINSVELLSSKFKSASYELADTDEFVEVDDDYVAETIKSLTRALGGLKSEANLPLLEQLVRCMNNVVGSTATPAKSSPCISTRRTKNEFIVKIDERRAESIVSDLESVMEPSDFRKSDNLEWENLMEVSDDSDVEPGALLSDEDECPKPSTAKMCLLKFRNLAAVHTLVNLLERGESPAFLLKHLLLFACTHADTDTSELPKLVAASKALKKTGANSTILLSDCVERLTRISSTKDTGVSRTIDAARRFTSANISEKKTDMLAEEIEVDFDQQLAESLLADIPPSPVEEPHFMFPIIETNQLDTFFTLGDDLTV